jgi:hypothetical protein
MSGVTDACTSSIVTCFQCSEHTRTTDRQMIEVHLALSFFFFEDDCSSSIQIVPGSNPVMARLALTSLTPLVHYAPIS